MKILHFYKSYLPDSVGGVEKVINQIILAGSSYGIEAEVLTLTPTNKKSIIVDNHFVHRCKSNFEIASTPFSFSAIHRFKNLTKSADVIHYHFPYPYADLMHFITRVQKPSIITYHSDIVKQENLFKIYFPLMNKFLGSVNQIVATSPNYLNSSKVLSKYRDKVRVIPIGLDKLSYPKINKKKLEYWKLKFGNKFFLFIGIFRYYKGLHVAIDAAKNSRYPIVFVGNGPCEKELKVKVKNLKINNIHFVDRVSELDKVALIKLSYAILFPSQMRSEAFGVTLLEGAMFAKPLISAEINTGTSYININNKTGIVVPSENSVALRQAMDYLWNNPLKAKIMGSNAEKRYRDLFTADKMAKSYYNLYKAILRKSKNF
jgi:O-antigen biosynthesis rhamnosyltransferase